MAGVYLGVDYGTSNTVAVLRTSGRPAQPLLFHGTPLLPSAVYAETDGRLLTGRDALRSARLDPTRFEPNPKRRIDDQQVLLGDRGYRVVDLVTATLGQVALEAARVAGAPVRAVTVTCPVEWGPARRSVLANAATAAGLPAPTLIPEPVAAATYFASTLGRRVNPGQSVVVYDLGGGTFDACVVRATADGFEPLAYRGLDDFGGIDLDQLVIDAIREAVQPNSPETWQRLSRPGNATDRRSFRALWDDARSVKESLSQHPTATLMVPILDRDMHVAREQFERAAAEPLRRTVEVTMATLRASHVGRAEVAGVFLVGGSTRVPMVATLLHRATGIAPTVIDQPETVVAGGALTVLAGADPATGPAAPSPVPPVDPPPVPMGGLAGPPPAPPAASPVAPPARPAEPVSSDQVSLVAGVALMSFGPFLMTCSMLTESFVVLMVCSTLGGLVTGAGGLMFWRRPGFPAGARFAVPAVPLFLFAVLYLFCANGDPGFTQGNWSSVYTGIGTDLSPVLWIPGLLLLALTLAVEVLAALRLAGRGPKATRAPA